jgi:D-arabinose 1-dehydrogenase-like Zn-dependent alcohol dehydrogenase
MKAARIVKLNEPLQIQEFQTPTSKGTQVLVKIQSSGVCHSDVHVWKAYYEGIGGQTINRGVKYPLILGHEIAGIVDSFAEQVEGFSKNEMVELVLLAKRGIIKPVVSERFKLDQAREALSKLKDGKITGRGVMNP